MLVNMIAESVLDETIQRIDAKTLLLKEREKLLEDMENKITYLRSVLSSLKDESLLADERLKALQEEVHLLWDVSRKNNFELHVLELKAQDAEERLEAVTSKVEKKTLKYLFCFDFVSKAAMAVNPILLPAIFTQSVLDGTIQRIDAKTLLLKEREKLLEDMENKITYLRSVQSSLKDESLLADERLKALQEEVHLLWDVSRKNNFELHVLELKAQDAEERLEAVTSKVEKKLLQSNGFRFNILSRHFKLHKLGIAISKAKVYEMHILEVEHYSFGLGSTMNYYMSQAFPQSRRFYSATKKYHHELQGFIKQEMRRNEFTATFANDELVFFLASALITFPVLSAWMALSSRLN
ncbi:tropomyosin-like isoform X2 [Hibiscus syriacus]|uniref:Tropomyosin-like isoform X2 n=1 Tax=Hibiscus syriacus TaxID=106335 RepID=A0A6A2XFU8_HIBSY|nr:tropomyosin-like isoform X2 [Hibiscus syriacus]